MRVIEEVEKRLGRKFALRHCANTGAVARYPETFLDMVRPGLLLYGYGGVCGRAGAFAGHDVKDDGQHHQDLSGRDGDQLRGYF